VDENDGDKGGSNCSPNSSANAVGMNAMKSISPQAARYANIIVNKNKLCLSPKYLYASFSEVADKDDECMPTFVLEAPNLQPCMQVPMVRTQEKEIRRVPAGATSIMHAALGTRHAGAGSPTSVSGLMDRAEAPPSPATPATRGQPTGPAATRPAMHGSLKAMQPTSVSTTSIKQIKVIKSPNARSFKMNFDLSKRILL
jgi:hypothetical protein